VHVRSSRLPPLPPHLWPYLFPRFLATSRCLVLSPASPAPLSLSNGCYASFSRRLLRTGAGAWPVPVRKTAGAVSAATGWWVTAVLKAASPRLPRDYK